MTDYNRLILKKVGEFQSKFQTPTDTEFWAKLMQEEVQELLSATDPANELKEACDVAYVSAGYQLANKDNAVLPLSEFEARKFEAATMIMSRLQMLYGPALMYDAFKRVHNSNMSKLGDDGKPVRREDGKILKGPNYKPADLSDLVKRVHPEWKTLQ